jgi:hypothetical protein
LILFFKRLFCFEHLVWQPAAILAFFSGNKSSEPGSAPPSLQLQLRLSKTGPELALVGSSSLPDSKSGKDAAIEPGDSVSDEFGCVNLASLDSKLQLADGNLHSVVLTVSAADLPQASTSSSSSSLSHLRATVFLDGNEVLNSAVPRQLVSPTPLVGFNFTAFVGLIKCIISFKFFLCVFFISSVVG